MIYLYNKELEKIGTIGKDDLREFTTTEELNSQWIVEISYPFSLHKKEAEYIGFKDNNEFKLYKLISTSRSDDFIDINGVHIFFHDLKGKVIRDIRPNNKTALQVATEILKDTDWEVFSTAKGLNTTNFYYVSKLDAFHDLLEKWQCEFRLETYFDGDKFIKKIYLEDHISKDYGRWFEYGDKLLTVIAEENHSNVFTAFIGRGKGEETGDGYSRKIKFDKIAWSIANGNPINKPVGQDYVEIKEATKLYGYPDGNPRIAVVDFDEDDRENLLRLTYEYALENSRPKLQLKATAVDDKKIELGEVCAIIRPNLDIRYKTRIFKVKTDRLSDLQEFEFGDKIVISRSDRIRAEQKTKEKELQEIESRLEQALKNVDIDFNNEDGYNYDLKAGNKYNLPAGYYSFNKPIDENPTKVTYLGAGKVLIADEKGSDGSWKWKTALDGNGIYGSEIVTHSITANKLAADVGQSLDLSSNESITLKVKSTTKDYIDKNKDQLKGDKGDKGDRGEQGPRGVQGLQGPQGVQGPAGKDGRATYTWIRYADTASGGGISNSPTGKEYIGLAHNKDTPTESDTPTDYTWSLIRGPQGKTGNRGVEGPKGKDGQPTYTWIKYSANANGSGLTDTPQANTAYIGIATNKTTPNESSTPSDYAWSLFKGPKGEKGDRGEQGLRGLQGKTGDQGIPGKNGTSSYTHIAYANSADGKKGFNVSHSTNKLYIGMYVDENKSDSDDPEKYKWTLIKGQDGKDGTPGKPGADGKTPYLHIAYANSEDGSKDFNVIDSNRSYIGQYTDYEKKDSTDPSKYTWSKIQGADGTAFTWNIYKGGAILDKSNWVKYDADGLNINDEEIFFHSAKKETNIMGYYRLNEYNDILEQGKTYTVSFDAKNIRDDVGLKFSVNGFSSFSYVTLKPLEEKRVVITGVRHAGRHMQIQANNLDVGYNVKFEMKNLKIEEGAVTNTIFTPHPDELEPDYTEFRTEYEADIKVLGDKIDSKVEMKTYDDNNKLVNEKFTQIEQTAKEIVSSVTGSSSEALKSLEEEIIEKLGSKLSQEEIQELIDGLENQIQEVSTRITQTNDSFTQEYKRIKANIEDNKVELEKLTGVIQSGLDENGNTYTDWVGDGENRVRVGSDGIVMLSNNAETLKLKDGRGYMNSLYVEHELGLGNHTARKMGTEFTVFMPIGGQK